jgi:hypothetical protein
MLNYVFWPVQSVHIPRSSLEGGTYSEIACLYGIISFDKPTTGSYSELFESYLPIYN